MHRNHSDQEATVFVVRTDTSVKNWRIPSDHSHNYWKYATTLCQTLNDNETMKISVSTRSMTALNFTLKVRVLDDDEVFLTPGKPVESVEVSPSTQQLFHFSFENRKEKKYLLTVHTNESCPVCTTVSVQPETNCKTEVDTYFKDFRLSVLHIRFLTKRKI